ncbi:MAG: alpha-ketoacid dehydrogenase subunit beta [Desulfobacteraceae bacterium]|nr:alpha-ketoacid dehydrogenase subunit beta [Desulfobacteraceae bacterium]
MKMTYGTAIREALLKELEDDKSVVLFGEDIQHNLYGYTDNLVNIFGKKRVINTPLSEAAIVGTAVGAAMCGLTTIVDLTVANFLYVAMDQIANMAAKTNYMYNGQFKLPLTIMVSTLYNSSSAAQHSDRPHPIFMNTPGLKIVVPSCPQDAYSLLRSAIVDENPVIYFSDRSLFYTKEDVDVNCNIKIGQASVLTEGSDITVVTISGCSKIAMDLLPELINENISAEIIDVRSLVPLDINTIKKSVRKTGRVVIADTAHKSCSAASEISSILAEDLFYDLKAPIGIVAYDDVPVPFAKNLELQIMPTKEKIYQKVVNIMQFNK